MFAVVYVGAPYGDNEFGHVLSRHRTWEAAERARQKLLSNPRYYGSNSTVKEMPKPISKKTLDDFQNLSDNTTI